MVMVPLLDQLTSIMLRRRLRGVFAIRRLLNHICTTNEVRFRTSHGLLFYLRPEDDIDNGIFRQGYYESEVLDAMLRELPEGGIIWDVGANFGLHAITLKHLRPDARVICFEPSPEQAGRLLRHSRENKTPVEVHCIGLGLAKRIANLHLVHSGNPGLSTFVPQNEYNYDMLLPSRVERGDDLIMAGSVPAPDVIKLDIERSEEDAMLGLRQTLASGSVSLVLEGTEQIGQVVHSLGYPSIVLLTRNEGTDDYSNYVASRWVRTKSHG
jgi:FkbM family methyltransferase